MGKKKAYLSLRWPMGNHIHPTSFLVQVVIASDEIDSLVHKYARILREIQHKNPHSGCLQSNPKALHMVGLGPEGGQGLQKYICNLLEAGLLL